MSAIANATAAHAAPHDGSAGSAERGRALFRAYCALCHGEAADGRGVRAGNFQRRPADFTEPQWQRPEAYERALRSIHEGVPGTPMAAWNVLGEEAVRDLAAYVVSVGAPR